MLGMHATRRSGLDLVVLRQVGSLCWVAVV